MMMLMRGGVMGINKRGWKTMNGGMWMEIEGEGNEESQVEAIRQTSVSLVYAHTHRREKEREKVYGCSDGGVGS